MHIILLLPCLLSAEQLTGEERFKYDMAAQAAVKEHLKYPDDATFNPGLFSRASVTRVSTDIHVNGKVRAKNALGAELTYEYTVVFDKSDTLQIVMLDGKAVYAAPELLKKFAEPDAPPASALSDDERNQYLDAAQKAMSRHVRGTTDAEIHNGVQLRGRPEAVRVVGRATLRQGKSSSRDVEFAVLFSETPKNAILVHVNGETVNRNSLYFRQKSASAGKANVEYRTWRDSSGKFSVEAAMIGRIGESVRLLRKDGERVTVPIERLSEEDKRFVEEG